MPSETFKRLAVAYPDRVGNAGFFAELDGYRVDVVDMGRNYRWSLAYNDRHVTSGEAIAPALAWLRGCDVIDLHKAALTAALEAAS